MHRTPKQWLWQSTLIHFLSAALKVCMCAGNEQETLPPSQINHNNYVVTSFMVAELLLLSTFCLNVVLKAVLEALRATEIDLFSSA